MKNMKQNMTAPCLSGVTSEGTMTSNLPLLFADGFPTCLETITEEQLEKFVPFMIQCSTGRSMSNSSGIPKWWPLDLPFALPLMKPEGMGIKWMAVLKSLVCRCYSYHGCEFMLPFCTELAKYPKSRLRFSNDWVGTTSVYDRESGKLLVTFRDENRSYDRKKETPRKSLLPRFGPALSPSKVRVTPLFPDIYLCDNCDAEFKTLEEVKNHEKCCQGPEKIPLICTKFIPEDLSTHQETFLDYFELQGSSDSEQTKESLKTESAQFKRPISTSVRYAAIPFSSPIGIILNKKIRIPNMTYGVQLERIERHCAGISDSSPPRTRESRNVNDPWPVTWKPSRKKDDNVNGRTHIYRFPTRQYRRRIQFKESNAVRKRKHLLQQMKNCVVKLHRLTKEKIEFYTSKKMPALSRILHGIHTSFKCNNSSKVVNTKKPSDTRVSHKIVSAGTTGGDTRTCLDTTIDHSKDIPLNIVPLEIVTPINILGPSTDILPFSMQTQLIPNTLYTYDERLMVTKSTPESIGHNEIMLIDLCSSDDEKEPCDVNESNSEVLNKSIKQCDELNSELQVDYREDPPELFEMFTPHIVHYFPDNEPGAYVNSRSCKSTANIQEKHTPVLGSMLGNPSVASNIATSIELNHYNESSRNVRRASLRTRNCDDVSRKLSATHEYIKAGEDSVANIKRCECFGPRAFSASAICVTNTEAVPILFQGH